MPRSRCPNSCSAADALPGVAADRVAWLRAVAQAALDGALDAARLAAMEPDDALAHLQKLPGIGPTYATLILLRATGVTDALTFGEPRLPGYVAHFYGPAPGRPPPASSSASPRAGARTGPGPRS